MRFPLLTTVITGLLISSAAAKQKAREDLTSQCHRAYERIIPALQELRAKLPRMEREPSGVLHSASALRGQDCHETGRAEATAKALLQALNHHSGRIGIMLPLTGGAARAAQEIRSGFEALMKTHPNLSQDNVVVMDSGASVQTSEAALAQLIFVHEVGMIIGGLPGYEAELLHRWSEKLALPVILLNGKNEYRGSNPYAFSVFPDITNLAEASANQIRKHGYKRVAIMRPQRPSAHRFSQSLKQYLEGMPGISIVNDVGYESDSYESMEAAAKEVFKVDRSTRSQEFQMLYKKRRELADQQGVRFYPNTVMLKPIVDADVVVIADNFRNVRHMINIFKYLGVEKLATIGHHEWRSEGLLLPPEPFLDGAIFSDFIGSYQSLPPGLRVPTTGSPYLARPQHVQTLDHRILGYLALDVAARLDRSLQNPRRDLPRRLASLTIADDGDRHLLPSGTIFKADRAMRWPTYSFVVRGSKIDLIPPTPNTPPNPGKLYQPRPPVAKPPLSSDSTSQPHAH